MSSTRWNDKFLARYLHDNTLNTSVEPLDQSCAPDLATCQILYLFEKFFNAYYDYQLTKPQLTLPIYFHAQTAALKRAVHLRSAVHCRIAIVTVRQPPLNLHDF
jgi:hypothetical protein